ncbi:MAG: signal peptide peptidase SppA [Pirellulaceae bacterium]
MNDSPQGSGPQNQEIVHPEMVRRPASAPARTSTALAYRFLGWLSWMGWVAFFFCLISLLGITAVFSDYFNTNHGIREKYVSGSKSISADKVAVLTVSGVIGMVDDYVKSQIERIREDDKVKAIVLRIDSPGGTITGSDYILHHLNQLTEEKELPLVASMGSVAASGGYYVAMAVGDQENSIFAEPTTTTGSIGVIVPHYDISGLMEKYDVKDDSIASHPRKKMLSMTHEMGEEERTIVQEYVMDAFTRFKDVVKSGRPKFRNDEVALNDLATGQIYTANQALQLGLVDQHGFIEDAVVRAAELAGLDEGDYKVIKYSQPLTLMDALTSARAPSTKSGTNFEAALRLSTPQAYYLHSSAGAALPLLLYGATGIGR